MIPFLFCSIAVLRPILKLNGNAISCPGIGRRIGDYPNIKPWVPIRYNSTTDNNSNSTSTIVHLNSNLPKKFDIDIKRENRLKQIFEQNSVDLSKTWNFFCLFSFHFDLDELRAASWNGIPKQYRAQAWRLLCVRSITLMLFIIEYFYFKGYLPAKIERRTETLTRKRDEYWSYVSQYYHTRTQSEHQDTFRQVDFDEYKKEKLFFIIVLIL